MRHSCGATDRSGPPTRTASFLGLLAAEITARTRRDPGEVFDGSRANWACRSTNGSTRPRHRRTERTC